MPNERKEERKLEVLCAGELLVDFVAEEAGNLASVQQFSRAAGGAAANVAVGMARLGRRVGFAGMVGNDPFGSWLTDVLRNEDVDVSLLGRTDQARTTLAFVALDEKGERDFVFYRLPGADQLLSRATLNPTVLARLNPAIFYWGGVGLSTPLCRQAIAETLEGDTGDLLRVFDPNFRLPLWTSPEEMITICRHFLSYTDVLKVSYEEGVALCDDNLPEENPRQETAAKIAEQLLIKGSALQRPMLVALTNGAAGCVWSWTTGAGEHRTSSVPGKNVRVIDTTGAGDAFFAALLDGLLTQFAGRSPSRALAALEPETLDRLCQRANEAGAFCVGKRGAIPGLALKHQLDL